MLSYLKQSTASQTRIVGPFVDDTDFKTVETGLTIANTDVKLSKNGGTAANKNSGGGTHIANGDYAFTFDATDTDTVGELSISISVSGALICKAKFVVLEEAVYDSMFASGAAGPLDAAGTRSAMGLANADLDTQLDAIVADTNEIQVDWADGGRLDLILDARASQSSVDTVDGIVDQILVDTAVIGAAGAGLTAIPWNASWDAEVQSECTDALNAYDPPTKTELDTAFTEIKGATWSSGTDTLEAIRDRGDAAWTTGAGGSPPDLLQSTTIATLASQTSFTLTAGSADDDAYNGAIAIITDSATSTQKAVGAVSDYTGSTKTITLSSDPAIFTMAVGDTIDIVASTGTGATAAAIRAEIDSNSTQLAAIVQDTAELQTNQGNWLTATGFSTHSAGDAADAVWNEAAADHLTGGSFGAEWDAAHSYLTTGGVADDVHDADLTNYTTPGSAGQTLTDIVTDTAEIGSAGAGLTAIPWNSSWDAEVQSECTDALNAYDPPTHAEVTTAFTEIKGATWSSSTDTLEEIRDRGDAAWTGGGSGSDLLQTTTIATLASQTSFTLTAGSSDDDAYNGATVIVTDSATSTQKAVGHVLNYTGSTKTITLASDPGIFTMAAGDTIDIVAGTTVNDLTAAALAKFITTDTGESTAATGSVAKIAQGAAGGNVTVGSLTQAALAQFATDDTGESTAATRSVAKLSQAGGQEAFENTNVATFTLRKGDSYDGTANPLVSFTVAKDYTGWTGTLVITHRVTGATIMSASVTVASSTSLTVTLTTTETAFALLTTDDDFGPHPYDLQMTSGSNSQTASSGVALIKKA